MFEGLGQNLVFGILVGALYGLVALGLSLVFGVTKFLNVAHGELLMFGGYASFWAFSLLDLDPFLTIPITIVFLFLIGALLYKFIFSRTVKLPEETKIKNTLLVAFGLSVILQNLALRFWTADDRGMTADYASVSFTIMDVRFPLVTAHQPGCSNSLPGGIADFPAQDLHRQSHSRHCSKLGGSFPDGY